MINSTYLNNINITPTGIAQNYMYGGEPAILLESCKISCYKSLLLVDYFPMIIFFIIIVCYLFKEKAKYTRFYNFVEKLPYYLSQIGLVWLFVVIYYKMI